MKILLIHQAFASPGEPGGTRHYDFARHLVRRGHRVTVLGSDASYMTGKAATDSLRLADQASEVDGVEIRRCYTYSALHRSFYHRLIAYWSFTLSSFIAGLQVRGVDVVWGTSPPIFQAVTALLLARLKHRAFILEVRDLWPDFAIDLRVLRSPLLIRLSRWLERLLYRQADRIIVNSPGFLPHLRQCGVPEGMVAVVANGVEPSDFDPSLRTDDLRVAWGVADRFVVLYAGAHGLANDLETVLAAAAELRDRTDIAFVLVGDGKEKLNLVARARELALDNVVFVPSQPKAMVPKVLAAADVCVATLRNIPMFTTTYPNKVFDYMAAGRPTILAIDGVIRDVIEGCQGGLFVPPGDEKALAAAVLALRDDLGLRETQGANARRCVEERFNRSRQAEDLERELLSVACEPLSRRSIGLIERISDLVR